MVEDSLETLLTAGGVTAPLTITSKANIPGGDGPYIGLRSTGGTGPSYIQNQASPACRYPAFQFVVTALNSEDAFDTAEAIYGVMAKVHNLVVGTLFFLSIRPLQEPIDLGLDDVGRARVSFNVLADYRQATAEEIAA